MFPVKHVTIIKLTDEGRKQLPEAKDVFVKATEVVDSLDGKSMAIWATTGRYDFVTCVEYPTAEAGLKAYTPLLETGFSLRESSAAFDRDTSLAAFCSGIRSMAGLISPASYFALARRPARRW